MTKEKQALSDEHQKQMDQTKGVSTHVPTDNINKFEIYLNISNKPALTTGRMIPSGTNSPPAEVSTQ
jgi:hypothetical protein